MNNAFQVLRPTLAKMHLQQSMHTGIPLCFSCTVVKSNKNMEAHMRIKRKKKVEKDLRLLERKGERHLKPIEEFELSVKQKQDLKKGLRQRQPVHYTSEELESQVLLMKDWCRYKMKEHWLEMAAQKRVEQAQEDALNALREESEDLYQQAIQRDEGLLTSAPFKGPVYTPSIPDYHAEDGKYIDKTNYFDDPALLGDFAALYTDKKKRLA